MQKIYIAYICVICLTLLTVLSSSALFTDIETTGTYALSIGTLAVDMECIDVGGNKLFSFLDEDDNPWLPGDFRGSIIRLENRGTIDARWRLGIDSDADISAMMGNEIVLSFYRKDEIGNWQLLRSNYLKDFMVSNDEDKWIYDKELTGEEEFAALAAGDSQDLLLVVDFEFSAQAPLQDEEFSGKIILQGTQVSADEWFPSAEITLDIEEGEI